MGGTAGTIAANIGKVDGTVAVYLHSTSGTLGVNVGKIEGTSAIYLHSTGGTLGVRVGQVDGSIAVYLVGTGGTLGVRVGQIDGSAAVHLVGTGGTLRIGDIPGTISVQFSPSVPSIKKDVASTGSYNSVELVPMQRQIIASNSSRKSVALVHDSSNTVYIGLSNALTTGSLGTGFPIVSNQIIAFDDYTGAIWGAMDTGNVKIKYIEI